MKGDIRHYRIFETGDVKQETEDFRHEIGDVRQGTGYLRKET